jgi:adenine-specific DNA-methyltransferase
MIDELDASRGQPGDRPGGGSEAESTSARRSSRTSAAPASTRRRRATASNSPRSSPGPASWICAEGRYPEGEADPPTERRAGIFIGPEYGTVQRADLVACAREAAEAGFDIVIACAFNFDAHASEFHKLGRVPDPPSPDEPRPAHGRRPEGRGRQPLRGLRRARHRDPREGDTVTVELRGVDIFKPAPAGRLVDADEIACWFIDTDYNEESFFVRHAYFPGADIPYKALRTTLKAEIDEDAWESLKATVSRPFPKPRSGRIAVKVINHLHGRSR